MDQAIEHLWAAGYDLPPETQPAAPAPRRGKKAAKAKREKAKP